MRSSELGASSSNTLPKYMVEAAWGQGGDAVLSCAALVLRRPTAPLMVAGKVVVVTGAAAIEAALAAAGAGLGRKAPDAMAASTSRRAACVDESESRVCAIRALPRLIMRSLSLAAPSSVGAIARIVVIIASAGSHKHGDTSKQVAREW